MIVSLSILNIKKEDRINKIKQFMKIENNWIHFDVMDGVFVENKTFAYDVVKEVNEYCCLFKDVHLMTYGPEKNLKKYSDAGADQITFHYESIDENEIIPLIYKIKRFGMKVGMSIKPSTEVSVIDKYLPYLDLVLVMSVEPGKGGQKYLDSTTGKIELLNSKKNNYHYLISVDGGIDDNTCKIVKAAGADIIVVGSYLAKEEITIEKIETLM